MKGFGQRFSAIFFILLSLALLVFGRNDNQAVESGRATVFDGFTTVLEVLSKPLETADDFVSWTQNLALVYSENERLRQENTRLRQEQIAASQLVIDNQRLSSLLNIREGHVTTIAASRVVSDSGSPFFKSVLINSGRDDGIRKGMAVVNEQGIVGRTINVGSGSARVLLVTDLNSRVPVKIASSGINVILEGDNSNQPLLNFLPLGAKVKVGDLVLTSGFAKVFPPDLPVGRVVEVSEEDGIRVNLAANLYRLNYVSVLGYDIASSPDAGVSAPETPAEQAAEEQN
ncbi:rod shape-determining protein MreC [Emcibacter nanhaiensis]|uniref:Cell shape-determining protein MreC n=1 Tax=Emcibacter nanhaiensis TaxID=1505037 RepID=A0A501PBG3_9PROT|nr:rod shape-determining protein MreC [Emcibacter nanhaiensis]TPD57575.1 rod shape-determining protein MreC [Emcibacter nanhaiensis]